MGYSKGSLKNKNAHFTRKAVFRQPETQSLPHTNPCKNQTDSVSFSHFCRPPPVITANPLINKH